MKFVCLIVARRTVTNINLGSNLLRGPAGALAKSNWTRVLCEPTGSLVELNLGYNKMGEPGAAIMAEALGRGCTLTILNLRANEFEADTAVSTSDTPLLCCSS